ncbi:MAG: YgaP-like transmembrane domain [Acidiferrobacteraceae bacterium]
MSVRAYRFMLGTLLLTFLYFNLTDLIFALIAIVLIEGATNLRIDQLINAALRAIATRTPSTRNTTSDPVTSGYRFNFEAERAWRLLVGLVLLLSYALLHNPLWFFPWFMGFGILGAGISGVCPMLIGIKWCGFK